MKKLIRENRWTLLATSVIILLPVLAGLLLWPRLPDPLPTHFGLDNQPNGWTSKAFTVFGIPTVLLALQWLCVLFSRFDRLRGNIPGKLMGAVLWIIPGCSLLVCLLSYGTPLGMRLNAGLVVNLFLGVVFVISGNYLPKSRQSYVMGIKLPWTLKSAENWRRTHHLAGYLWIAGGAVCILNAFLLSPWLLAGAIALMVAVPTFYSWMLSRRGV